MGKPLQLNQMLEKMTQNGLRVTEQRRTLVRIFTDYEGYLSPRDVYNKMAKHYPGVSFDTVYRNLRLLSDMGLLEQLYFMDGRSKFKGCCLPNDHHHHHHLICLHCEKTVPVDFCPMEYDLDLPQNFQIVNHRFEIYGLCEQCQHQAAITKTS